MKEIEFRQSYLNLKPKLEKVRRLAGGIIEEALTDNNIPFLQLQRRVKCIESACEKLEKKEYKDPMSEMTDLVGFRVIVYLNSDIERVSHTLGSGFITSR